MVILVDRGGGRPVIAIPVDVPAGATRPINGVSESGVQVISNQ